LVARLAPAEGVKAHCAAGEINLGADESVWPSFAHGNAVPKKVDCSGVGRAA
jgi:hypothetical protein